MTVAHVLGPLLCSAIDRALPFRIDCWDGSSIGPPDAELQHPVHLTGCPHPSRDHGGGGGGRRPARGPRPPTEAPRRSPPKS